MLSAPLAEGARTTSIDWPEVFEYMNMEIRKMTECPSQVMAWLREGVPGYLQSRLHYV